jgi:hypothetical protein
MSQPAFPQQFNGTTEPSLSGMTLRDYFAAQALQGIVRTFTEIGDYLPENLSEDAYKIADAMMEARKL